ncbi:hypothetical protein KJ632_00300 [Patescibacteria group bacterium]|nr:hypothetical protein [Patescibacteria group bacterium]
MNKPNIQLEDSWASMSVENRTTELENRFFKYQSQKPQATVQDFINDLCVNNPSLNPNTVGSYVSAKMKNTHVGVPKSQSIQHSQSQKVDQVLQDSADQEKEPNLLKITIIQETMELDLDHIKKSAKLLEKTITELKIDDFNEKQLGELSKQIETSLAKIYSQTEFIDQINDFAKYLSPLTSQLDQLKERIDKKLFTLKKLDLFGPRFN